MEVDELKEAAEHAETRGEKRVGLTMAIVAAFLAFATMFGHRTHTEEVVLQTRASDEWAYYQAKNSRSHMYQADARLAMVTANGKEVAAQLAEDGKKEAEDAQRIRHDAEHLEDETVAIANRAKYFDIAEVMLEVSIVLCSVTLLTRVRTFWLSSFFTTLSGLGLIAFGALR